MKITLLAPYYGGSHRAWVDGFTQHTRHDVHCITLPAQFWKWRMQGGAVTLAWRYLELAPEPDVIIASDMMDVSIFRAITRTSRPIALYFHENQLTYPQNQRQGHGWRYGFINYASALAADRLYFNSAFHRDSFFEALPRMLKHFGDYNELETVAILRDKAQVLPLGLALKRFDTYRSAARPHDNAVILWNHRWESEKNPQVFFDALYALDAEGIAFDVILAGANLRRDPQEFSQARAHFGERILHYGYADSFADYARLLWQADYVVSPSYQDFFGIAVAEAIYCGCVPLLADRLNYPYLLPQSYHHTCLFRDGALTGLLRQHLLGHYSVDTTALQKHIAQYDWATMIDQYDAMFDDLVQTTD
jgi:glycosyltransferase involved in cell wall biosynthesis